MCVGGNHWVGVGGSVSVGTTVPTVGVPEGVSVDVVVGVGVAFWASGFRNNIEMPMQ